ncbi:hypothetical protein PPROV_000571400 [Pycnococcus provasolii]|uniref:Dynein regulatory complex protein 9 n=1 Tax=Pycnococcus provasolii TaxID=41880 RepID=A0A830HMF2_9CHLO|nr:hypothetical protein PPROV_000571400 [Pycnococcus provasolii]
MGAGGATALAAHPADVEQQQSEESLLDMLPDKGRLSVEVDAFDRAPSWETATTAPSYTHNNNNNNNNAMPLTLSRADRVSFRMLVRRALQRLALVGRVKESSRIQAKSYSRNVTDRVTADLAEQHKLEDEFLRIMDKRTHVLTKTNRQAGKSQNKFAESAGELATLTVELRELTFKLVTHLKSDPNVPANVKRVAMRRGELESLLAASLDELASANDPGAPTFATKEVGVPTVLREMVTGELLKMQEEAEISRKESEASAAVRELRHAIKTERVTHDELMKQKVNTLANLRRQLKSNRDTDNANLSYRHRTLLYDNECSRRVEDTRLFDLATQKRKLQELKARENKDSGTVQTYLTQRASTLSKSASRWQTRYETDTVTKDKETETLKRDHQNSIVRMKEMEGIYQQEVANKELREAEERRMKVLERLNMESGERRNRAALKIQSLYRGWKARGGGKGKKKKGKGKKGKKK